MTRFLPLTLMLACEGHHGILAAPLEFGPCGEAWSARQARFFAADVAAPSISRWTAVEPDYEYRADSWTSWQRWRSDAGTLRYLHHEGGEKAWLEGRDTEGRIVYRRHPDRKPETFVYDERQRVVAGWRGGDVYSWVYGKDCVAKIIDRGGDGWADSRAVCWLDADGLVTHIDSDDNADGTIDRSKVVRYPRSPEPLGCRMAEPAPDPRHFRP